VIQFSASGGLFLWEAFVTGRAKAPTHIDDAGAAVSAFRDDKGRVCRHGVYSLTLGTYQRQIEGVACRQPDGLWSLAG